MTIEQYKSNSLKALSEGVIASDIADTDEIISAIVDQKQVDSLAYQICDVQTIHGPTGANFSVQYDTKAKVIRNNVQVEDDAIQDTGFTLEVIQDMQRTYGKDAIQFIGKTFGGMAARKENDKLISKLADTAYDSGSLTLSDGANAETIAFEISQKVAEEILTINEINYKTLDSFVVLPKKGAAAFLALGSYFSDEQNESGLFIGKKGRIKYYINPVIGDDNVYIGLNSKLPGNSSLIFSPYQHTLITAQDADSGETKVFNVNRYAITENSLSSEKTDDKMVRKFSLA